MTGRSATILMTESVLDKIAYTPTSVLYVALPNIVQAPVSEIRVAKVIQTITMLSQIIKKPKVNDSALIRSLPSIHLLTIRF